MYPVMLNIDGRKCVVVGGGQTALRKARKLAAHGGSVVAVSPEFIDGFEGFETVKKEYEASDLEGAFLVTAATNDREMNRRIVSDARRMKILSYAVDDPEVSDLILPASRTAGAVTVAASTEGKYPFLARRLRDEISENIDFYSKLLPLLEAYRAALLSKRPPNMRELMKKAVDDEMLALARAEIDAYADKLNGIADRL